MRGTRSASAPARGYPARTSADRSASKVVRGEGEPDDHEEDRQEKEDDAEDRDERRLAALTGPLDFLQVMPFGLDRLDGPTQEPAITTARVLHRLLAGAHGRIVIDRR